MMSQQLVTLAPITLVKILHSLIWAVMAAAVLYTLYSGITGNITVVTYVSIGLIALEGVVLSLNHGACPLTNVAKNVKPDWQHGDDLFLPTWIAIHNKTIFGTLFVLGLGLVIARLIFLK